MGFLYLSKLAQSLFGKVYYPSWLLPVRGKLLHQPCCRLSNQDWSFFTNLIWLMCCRFWYWYSFRTWSHVNGRKYITPMKTNICHRKQSAQINKPLHMSIVHQLHNAQCLVHASNNLFWITCCWGILLNLNLMPRPQMSMPTHFTNLRYLFWYGKFWWNVKPLCFTKSSA